MVATGDAPTLTVVLVPFAEVVAGVVVVVSLEVDVSECGVCASECELVESLADSDVSLAPLFPPDPAEDADADESLEPAPSSACATPVPVASAAPTPSVMAPAPSHA
jgi:hypothetical protein